MSQPVDMHTLGNHLASIQLNLEILLHHACSDKEKQKLLEHAFESAKKANTLIAPFQSAPSTEPA